MMPTRIPSVSVTPGGTIPPSPVLLGGCHSPEPPWRGSFAVVRRNIRKVAAAAVSAAVTPISSMATRPTCQPDGPTSASRPSPSGPPANAAARPARAPVAAPAAKPHSAAASMTGVGVIRTVTIPAKTPARYGMARTRIVTQADLPPDGRAASIGKTGSAPSDEPVGATAVPAPNANPGPSTYATAQMIALGAYASWASSSSTAPAGPGARASAAALTSGRCIASDTPARAAPTAVSRAEAPSMPRTIDRGRAGIKLASRDHGARPRAAPSPPATKASRNDATTACHRDGAAWVDRHATARAPASRV